jgi:hypothetical protein
MAEIYAVSTDFPHPEGGTDPSGRMAAGIEPLGDDAVEAFFVTNAELLDPPEPVHVERLRPDLPSPDTTRRCQPRRDPDRGALRGIVGPGRATPLAGVAAFATLPVSSLLVAPEAPCEAVLERAQTPVDGRASTVRLCPPRCR